MLSPPSIQSTAFLYCSVPPWPSFLKIPTSYCTTLNMRLDFQDHVMQINTLISICLRGKKKVLVCTIWKFDFPPHKSIKMMVYVSPIFHLHWSSFQFNRTVTEHSLAVAVIWKLLPLRRGQHAKIRLIQKCWHWVFPWFWSKRRGGTGFGQVAINMILVVAPCVCASSNFSFIWIRTLSSQLN